MGIQVKLRWNVKINGKEYHSAEEVPPELRDAYEKALAAAPLAVGGHGGGDRTGRITFNGREFAGIQEMPADVRRSYEAVLSALKSGEASPDLLAAARLGGIGPVPQPAPEATPRQTARFRRSPAAIAPEAGLPWRRLVVVGLLLAALYGLWYLLHGAGAP